MLNCFVYAGLSCLWVRVYAECTYVLCVCVCGSISLGSCLSDGAVCLTVPILTPPFSLTHTLFLSPFFSVTLSLSLILTLFSPSLSLPPLSSAITVLT